MFPCILGTRKTSVNYSQLCANMYVTFSCMYFKTHQLNVIINNCPHVLRSCLRLSRVTLPHQTVGPPTRSYTGHVSQCSHWLGDRDWLVGGRRYTTETTRKHKGTYVTDVNIICAAYDCHILCNVYKIYTLVSQIPIDDTMF